MKKLCIFALLLMLLASAALAEPQPNYSAMTNGMQLVMPLGIRFTHETQA